MEQRTSLTEIIEYINPGDLSYQEWINVGMALKQEGYSVHVCGARKILAGIMQESVRKNGKAFPDPLPR